MITPLSDLAKTQIALDNLGIGGGNFGFMTEITLALRALLGHDVALKSFRANDFTAAGHAETLCGTAVGFHLRHC